MKTKIISVVIAAVAVAVGYVISHPLVFHICSNTYQFNDRLGCLDDSIKSIGSPLLTFSLWVLLIVVITASFSEKTFQAWLKLAMWAIPLTIIFIALTPVSGYRMGIDFFPFYRDDAALLAGGVFSAASLVLIIWKYFSSSRLEQVQAK